MWERVDVVAAAAVVTAAPSREIAIESNENKMGGEGKKENAQPIDTKDRLIN